MPANQDYTITESDIHHAKLASAVYKDHGGTKDKVLKTKDKTKWTLLHTYPSDISSRKTEDTSGIRICIYQNKAGKTIISVRGSDNLTNVKDDAKLVLGLDPSCMTQVMAFLEETILDPKSELHQTLLDGNISFTGHSLGAWVAARATVSVNERLEKLVPEHDHSKPLVTATTFECPGILPWLKMNNTQRLHAMLKTFQVNRYGDGTKINSHPDSLNYINTAFGQAGKVFSIFVNIGTKFNFIETMRSNTLFSMAWYYIDLVSNLGKRLPASINKLVAKLVEVHSMHSMENIVRAFEENYCDAKDVTNDWPTHTIEQSVLDFCKQVDINIENNDVVNAFACAQTLSDVLNDDRVRHGLRRSGASEHKNFKLPLAFESMFSARNINENMESITTDSGEQFTCPQPAQMIDAREKHSKEQSTADKIVDCLSSSTYEKILDNIKQKAIDTALGYSVNSISYGGETTYTPHEQLLAICTADVTILSSECVLTADTVDTSNVNTSNKSFTIGNDTHIAKANANVGADFTTKKNNTDDTNTRHLQLEYTSRVRCAIKTPLRKLKCLADDDKASHTYVHQTVVTRGYVLNIELDNKSDCDIKEHIVTANLDLNIIPKILATGLKWNSDKDKTNTASEVTVTVKLIGFNHDTHAQFSNPITINRKSYMDDIKKLTKQLGDLTIKQSGQVDTTHIQPEDLRVRHTKIKAHQQRWMTVAQDVVEKCTHPAMVLHNDSKDILDDLKKEVIALQLSTINHDSITELAAVINKLYQQNVVFATPPVDETDSHSLVQNIELSCEYYGKRLYITCLHDQLLFTHNQVHSAIFSLVKASPDGSKFKIRVLDRKFIGKQANGRDAILVSENEACVFRFEIVNNSISSFNLITDTDNTSGDISFAFRVPGKPTSIRNLSEILPENNRLQFIVARRALMSEQSQLVDSQDKLAPTLSSPQAEPVYTDQWLVVHPHFEPLYSQWLKHLGHTLQTSPVAEGQRQENAATLSASMSRYLTEGVQKVATSSQKDIVVVMGKMGTGKSTLINVLLKNNVYFDGSNYQIHQTNAPGPQAKDGAQSITPWPEAHHCDVSDIVADTTITFVDTAGHAEHKNYESDSNEPERNALAMFNRFNLEMAFDFAQSVKGIILMLDLASLSSQNGRYTELGNISREVWDVLDIDQSPKCSQHIVFVFKNNNTKLMSYLDVKETIASCKKNLNALIQSQAAMLSESLLETNPTVATLRNMRANNLIHQKDRSIVNTILFSAASLSLVELMSEKSVFFWQFISDNQLRTDIIKHFSKIPKKYSAPLRKYQLFDKTFIDTLVNYVESDAHYLKHQANLYENSQLKQKEFEKEKDECSDANDESKKVTLSNIIAHETTLASINNLIMAINDALTITEVAELKLNDGPATRKFTTDEKRNSRTGLDYPSFVNRLTQASDHEKLFECEVMVYAKTVPLNYDKDNPHPVVHYVFRHGLVNQSILLNKDEIKELEKFRVKNHEYFEKTASKPTVNRLLKIDPEKIHLVEFTYYVCYTSICEYLEKNSKGVLTGIFIQLKSLLERGSYKPDTRRKNGFVTAPKIFSFNHSSKAALRQIVSSMKSIHQSLTSKLYRLLSCLDVGRQSISKDSKGLIKSLRDQARHLLQICKRIESQANKIQTFYDLVGNGKFTANTIRDIYKVFLNVHTIFGGDRSNDPSNTLANHLLNLKIALDSVDCKKHEALYEILSQRYKILHKNKLSPDEYTEITKHYKFAIKIIEEELKTHAHSLKEKYKNLSPLRGMLTTNFGNAVPTELKNLVDLLNSFDQSYTKLKLKAPSENSKVVELVSDEECSNTIPLILYPKAKKNDLFVILKNLVAFGCQIYMHHSNQDECYISIDTMQHTNDAHAFKEYVVDDDDDELGFTELTEEECTKEEKPQSSPKASVADILSEISKALAALKSFSYKANPNRKYKPTERSGILQFCDNLPSNTSSGSNELIKIGIFGNATNRRRVTTTLNAIAESAFPNKPEPADDNQPSIHHNVNGCVIC